LRLAAAGFRLGAACAIYMGVLTTVRDCCSGENGIQHFPFPGHAAASLDRPGGWRLDGARQRPDGSDVSNRSREILEHAGPVDRAGAHRDIPCWSRATTPLSWTNLI